jgi:signal transduction histidine kinase
VIADVVAELRPAAERAGATIAFDASEGAVVSCSRGLVVSVISNLVGNAIKYIGNGPEREILVRASPCRRGVRLEVLDTGPGLPPGFESIAFEPYVQGPCSRSGLGLGLATVKRIVERHGGAVAVESRPGRGCLFRVELPKAMAA